MLLEWEINHLPFLLKEAKQIQIKIYGNTMTVAVDPSHEKRICFAVASSVGSGVAVLRWLHIELRQACCVLRFVEKGWVASKFYIMPNMPQVGCCR